MHKGVPISPGVAIARAHRLDEMPARAADGPLDGAGLSAEVARFEQACACAAEELDDIVERLRTTVGEDQAAIFRAHRQLGRGPGRRPPPGAKGKSDITGKNPSARA